MYFESTKFFKNAGLTQIVVEGHFYIGSKTMRVNPAEVYFKSDLNATITVNGFYITVKRRITWKD